MRKLPVLSVLMFLSWFLVTGFGFFAPKKQEAKNSPSQPEATRASTSTPSDEKEVTPAEKESENLHSVNVVPEDGPTVAGTKKRKLSKEEIEKLKKEAERIRREAAIVKDTQATMNTTKALRGLATAPAGGGGGGGASSIPSVPNVPVLPSVPAIPSASAPAPASAPTVGLPAGVQSAIQTAQNIQSLQSTLDQIKVEQERIRREQERIRQERQQLEQQTKEMAKPAR